MRQIGAVDIGGTKIAVGIVREDGRLLDRNECPTLPERGFGYAVQRIQDMLFDAKDRCGAIVGVGIGCPGPLDPFKGIIGNVGTLPGWENAHLVDEIAARMGVTVAVENDADAAALAEYVWGSARTEGMLIYVTVSTGIGGGIVQNGKLCRGVRGAHREFGHQLIDPSGPLCYCGLSGCWESLASGTAMSAWYNSIDPGRDALAGSEICEKARKQDPRALKTMKREAHYLGLGLANLVTLFCPDVISLGGGVMKSSDLFFEEAQALVRKVCTQVPVNDTRIMLSNLGHEIGLLGAAQTWLLRNP